MARAIPVYQRQVIESGIQSAPTASGNVSATSPIAGALGGLGQAVGNVEQLQSKLAEDRAAVDVANLLSKGEVHWQEDFSKRSKAWAPDSPDMRDGIGQDFDKWVSEASQKLPTQASQNYFRQHAVAMRTRLQTSAFSFQEKVVADKLAIDTSIGIEDDKKIVFADPDRFDDLLRRRGETILARSDLSPAEKTKQVNEFKSALALARETGELTKDPAGWLKRNYGDERGQAAGGSRAAPTPSEAIANAIYGQESRAGKADTSKVNDQNVTGPMQMQEDTFNGMKRLGLIPDNYDWKNPAHNKDAGFRWVDHLAKKYNGDPEKVAAAYYGGEGAVNADGSINRSWGNKKHPGHPTVGQYVDQVVGRMKKEGAPSQVKVAAAGSTTASDAGNGMPVMPTRSRTLEALDLQQQLQLKAMAEQRMRQEDARVLASLSIEAAQQAVSSQDIGASASVDLRLATGRAIATAEQRLGRPLDASQQQQIESAVSHAAGVRERDRKRAQENTAGSMFDLLDQNGGDYQDLQRKMARELDDLPRETVERLNDYAGKVATGQTRPTDWQAYTQLIENPALLVQANLMALRDKFSAQEFNQLVKLQDSAKKAAESGSDQTIQSDLAVVKSLLDDAGVNGKDKQAQFFSVLQREMDVARAQSGKKSLKQAEVREIAADLLVREITHKGALWDTKERAFEIEVPARERPKIIAGLISDGIPVNESTILRGYRNKLRKSVPATGSTRPPATVASPFAAPVQTRPTLVRPSIYDGPDEWAAYHEEQKAAQ